jgi:hypothetical protein
MEDVAIRKESCVLNGTITRSVIGHIETIKLLGNFYEPYIRTAVKNFSCFYYLEYTRIGANGGGLEPTRRKGAIIHGKA